MNPEEEDDLFPRNFITCLGRPDNYIGPEEVFGSAEDDGSHGDDHHDGGPLLAPGALPTQRPRASPLLS